MKGNTKAILLYFLMLFPFYGFSQENTKIDTTYFLKEDTLFSNAGFNIYVGQTLYAGKGSLEQNRFQTIGFKSSLAFPLLFMRDKEIENNSEYRSDHSIRDADIVKKSFGEGIPLIVKRIKKRKGLKGTYWYQVYLKDTEKIFSSKYLCNIGNAIRLKEIKLIK
jgi:hypothetical protein